MSVLEGIRVIDFGRFIAGPYCGALGWVDADTGIPVEDVEALRTALERAPVDTHVVRYEGAAHGFHCDARPAAYDPDAAADAWQRTLAWFDEHLPPAGDEGEWFPSGAPVSPA